MKIDLKISLQVTFKNISPLFDKKAHGSGCLAVRSLNYEPQCSDAWLAEIGTTWRRCPDEGGVK